ncbi:MAG: glycosyltransferase family 4 protein [bacterium]|nr:glycosyltransferase family 4 protein [bacterium]
MTSRFLFLREHFRWMGRHSGYDPLCDEVLRMRPGDHRSVFVRRSLPPGTRPVFNRLRRRGQGSPFYNIYGARAEAEAFLRARISKPDLVHVTYVENQLGLLARYRDHLPARLVGTVHQPPGWYRLRHKNLGQLKALDALIVMGRAEARWFEARVPGRVHFVPYAVDTDFFRPVGPAELGKQAREPRCLFAGRWLRDLPALEGVIEQVLARDSKVGFDLLVPHADRKDDLFLRLSRHEQVRFHAGLDDDALLSLYRSASLLLLPMFDCLGNSVLLESLACGLPVVTNDVGALPDYTREAFADLLPRGDVAGMADAVLRRLGDPTERDARGQAARTFAEQELSWSGAARATLDIYDAVLAR